MPEAFVGLRSVHIHDDPWILHGEKRPVLHAAKESPGPGISPQLNPIDPPAISEKNRVARNSPKGRTDHHGLRRTTSPEPGQALLGDADRKSTRLNSSHVKISYAVFCLKKKKKH